MKFDDTHTDSDFERALGDQNEDLFAQAHQSEPDLTVDGLRGSLISRLLGLFG